MEVLQHNKRGNPAEKMRATVLCIALTLFCVAYAGATAVQKDFDLKKFLGTWHGLATATNSDWFLGKLKCIPCLAQLNLTADGNIELTRSYIWPENSPKSVSTYAVTSEPGVFHAKTLKGGYPIEFRVLETDYNKIAIAVAYMNDGDRKFTVVKLLSRTRDISADTVDKFEDYTLKKGLTKANIVFSPKKRGECSPPSNTSPIVEEP